MTPEGLDLLRRASLEVGLQLTAEQEQRFSELLRLLGEANAQFNLTALKTEADIVLKHFVDSLTCLRGGSLNGTLKLLDLGTGAGFPSLPLAIMRPELQITPLDSTRKKIDFVKKTAQHLGLPNVTPLVARAETLGQQPEYREQFDRVVVRAVAALPVLAELALPLLKPGGLLLAQKGPISEAELSAGRRAAGEVGGQVQEIDAFTLPILGDERTLMIVEKMKPTPAKYPRREGIPHQQPLFWSTK